MDAIIIAVDTVYAFQHNLIVCLLTLNCFIRRTALKYASVAMAGGSMFLRHSSIPFWNCNRQLLRNLWPALAIYEYIITLSQEVHTVWFQQWSYTSALLTTLRWNTVAMSLASALYASPAVSRFLSLYSNS